MTDKSPSVGASDADLVFEAMATRLLTPGHATSWLNHWSLLHADFPALSRMSTIGFDGTFLQMRLRKGTCQSWVHLSRLPLRSKETDTAPA